MYFPTNRSRAALTRHRWQLWEPVAVVHRHGEGADEGHWTTSARSSGGWHHYDDGLVSSIDQPKMTRDSHLIFCRRQAHQARPCIT